MAASIIKSIAELADHLARIVEVKSSEGHAVVNQQMTVGHIQGGQRNGEPLAQGLAQGDINRGVARKVVRGRIAVAEAGAVIRIGGSERPPGKVYVKARVQRVPLVVIEQEESLGRREIREAAAHASQRQG